MIRIKGIRGKAIKIMLVIAAGITTITIMIYNMHGYEEAKISYNGSSNVNDSLSEIKFFDSSNNELHIFKIKSDLVSRLSNSREYIIKRREKEDCIECKIEMPGILDKISKRYSLIDITSRTATVLNKEVQNIVTIQGDVNNKYVITYTIGTRTMHQIVDKEDYDAYNAGDNISIAERTFENKQGNRIIQYRIK